MLGQHDKILPGERRTKEEETIARHCECAL